MSAFQGGCVQCTTLVRRSCRHVCGDMLLEVSEESWLPSGLTGAHHTSTYLHERVTFLRSTYSDRKKTKIVNYCTSTKIWTLLITSILHHAPLVPSQFRDRLRVSWKTPAATIDCGIPSAQEQHLGFRVSACCSLAAKLLQLQFEHIPYPSRPYCLVWSML